MQDQIGSRDWTMMPKFIFSVRLGTTRLGRLRKSKTRISRTCGSSPRALWVRIVSIAGLSLYVPNLSSGLNEIYIGSVFDDYTMNEQKRLHVANLDGLEIVYFGVEGERDEPAEVGYGVWREVLYRNLS